MRVLIFGTVYVATAERLELAKQWVELHRRINPECDLVLVDSASLNDGDLDVQIIQTGDNIGHLARTGKDGWGRAFCAGLQYAIDFDYDYAVHIEGDSLCRLDVMKECEHMREYGLDSMFALVNGTKFNEEYWTETGLVFLSVPYLRRIDFIQQYNWPDGASKTTYPYLPEAVVFEILSQHNYGTLPIRNMRDDRKQLTVSNVKHYDWITHTTPEVYQAFIESMVFSENA